MNKLTKLKIELASVLAKFSEFQTDKGSIYSENEWITANVSVYIFGEDGSLLPAPDGDYSTPETSTTYKQSEVYTVVNGVVTDVKSINTMSETSEIVTETEEAPSTEVTPETETTTETVEQTATEIEQAEDVNETPTEEVTVTEEAPVEEDKLTKVYEMIDTLVKEIESLKTTVEALSTTMDNAKLGRETIMVEDNQSKSTVNKKFTYSAEKLKIKN